MFKSAHKAQNHIIQLDQRVLVKGNKYLSAVLSILNESLRELSIVWRKYEFYLRLMGNLIIFAKEFKRRCSIWVYKINQQAQICVRGNFRVHVVDVYVIITTVINQF